jgi:hypothetical protein
MIIKGHPIDLVTIDNLIDTVNSLDATVNKRTTTSFYVDGSTTLKELPTPSMSMEVAYIPIAADVKADQIKFDHTFNTSFAQPPIVTATLFDKANSKVAPNHSIVITSSTTSKVSGYIKFESSGRIDAGVNIIAIGYSNVVV